MPEPPALLPLSPVDYAAAKARARAETRPRGGGTPLVAPVAVGDTPRTALTVPTALGANFDGTNQLTAGLNPPDTVGAVGTDYFLEMTRSRIQIFDKYSGELFIRNTHDKSLEAFFGTGETLTDPRVVKDPLTLRWVAMTQGIPQPAGTNIYLAVSQGEDARLAWWFYGPIDVPLAPGEEADYPTLGVSNDAVLISINTGSTSSQVLTKSAVLVFPKPYILNNSLDCAKKITTDDSGAPLPFLLVPPIVRDDGLPHFLAPVFAPFGSTPATTLKIASGHDLSNPTRAGITIPHNVPAPANYTMPANAVQCNASSSLPSFETGFSQFGSASTQVGASLWNVHTISTNNGTNGAPTARFYELDLGSKTVMRSDEVYASTTSDDFNATTTADDSNFAFFTWTSLDATGACVKTQVRYSGLRPGEAAAGARPGDSLLTSASFSNQTDHPNTWGDLSAISIDPSLTSPYSCAHRAWLLNEYQQGTTQWGSRIAAIGLC